MIVSFRHRGLERLWNRRDPSRLNPNHVVRINRILQLLDIADKPSDMSLSGYDLHRLKGFRSATWAVKVSANWRITFEFDGRDAYNVDLVDYH